VRRGRKKRKGEKEIDWTNSENLLGPLSIVTQARTDSKSKKHRSKQRHRSSGERKRDGEKSKRTKDENFRKFED